MANLFDQVVRELERQREVAHERTEIGKGSEEEKPKKKVWKQSQVALGDLARKKRREGESELAALRRVCGEYVWLNPRTGKCQDINPVSLQKSLYLRDVARKPSNRSNLRKP